MDITNVKLAAYGPFENVDVPLWSKDKANRKVTILIGENGAGKSCFVEGVATLLSWLAARIRNEKSSGNPILPIQMWENRSSFLSFGVEVEEKIYQWALVRNPKGFRSRQESKLSEATELANLYAERLTADERASLPMLAYYPVERYVLDIPQKIRTRHSFRQINGYEESFTRGIDFRRFFEWFREREDIINENKISFDEIIPFLNVMEFLSKTTEEERRRFTSDSLLPFLDMQSVQKFKPALARKIQSRERVQNDPQYLCVLRALEFFLPEYKNLRIERRPRMQMLIDKNEKTLNILQLSQGEKSLLALVGDIARRLAIMNPCLDDPLQGEGVVLIDEVDLHLHPRWQRTVVRRLRETFPKCQFILTTHSPLVISDPDNVQVLILDNGVIREAPEVYGMDVEQVFLEVMKTPLRYEPLQEKIDLLLESIQDRNFALSRQLRQELGADLPDDHRELARADILLRRQEALHAKDS